MDIDALLPRDRGAPVPAECRAPGAPGRARLRPGPRLGAAGGFRSRWRCRGSIASSTRSKRRGRAAGPCGSSSAKPTCWTRSMHGDGRSACSATWPRRARGRRRPRKTERRTRNRRAAAAQARVALDASRSRHRQADGAARRRHACRRGTRRWTKRVRALDAMHPASRRRARGGPGPAARRPRGVRRAPARGRRAPRRRRSVADRRARGRRPSSSRFAAGCRRTAYAAAHRRCANRARCATRCGSRPRR